MWEAELCLGLFLFFFLFLVLFHDLLEVNSIHGWR